MKNRYAVLLAILAAALYAVSSPVSKLLLEWTGPLALAGYLYLGAGIGLLALRSLISLRKGDRALPRGLTRTDGCCFLLMILLDSAAPILLLLGLRQTTAANVSLLNNFEIVATAVIAFSFFRERISKGLWCGIGFVTLACAVLSFEDMSSLDFRSVPSSRCWPPSAGDWRTTARASCPGSIRWS